MCVYIYLHQAEDNLFVSLCDYCVPHSSMKKRNKLTLGPMIYFAFVPASIYKIASLKAFQK